jgi:hypothetical protein
LNYFNYFSEIEDTFVRRRAKHLLLSSIDWALIEGWKEMGIPLHVVLRGIEKAFDSWESKPRKRSVKTLLYCQEEVEAQYAEWLESRVGAGDSDEVEAAEAADKSSPFSRESILSHLRRVRDQINNSAAKRSLHQQAELFEAFTRAEKLLFDIEEELISSAQPDAKKIEVSLTGIDRMLGEALLMWSPDETKQELTDEIKKQLQPYRRQMETSMYEQTFDNLLLKRLREQFDVPRLSLFHLVL